MFLKRVQLKLNSQKGKNQSNITLGDERMQEKSLAHDVFCKIYSKDSVCIQEEVAELGELIERSEDVGKARHRLLARLRQKFKPTKDILQSSGSLRRYRRRGGSICDQKFLKDDSSLPKLPQVSSDKKNTDSQTERRRLAFRSYQDKYSKGCSASISYDESGNCSCNSGTHSSLYINKSGTRQHSYNALLHRINHLNSEYDQCYQRAKYELSSGKVRNHTKKLLVLEDYKKERRKRTQDLLKEVEVTDPRIVSVIYDYRLGSVLEEEQEVFNTLNKFRNMLHDPKREVAKIERQRHSKNRLAILIKRSHHKSQQFRQY